MHARLLVGASVAVLLSGCEVSTPCGAGHYQAKNDRDGAAITYCVARDGRANGAYDCTLHGERGAVNGSFSFNKKHGEWRYFAEKKRPVRVENWRDGELLDTKILFDGEHKPLNCDEHVIFAAAVKLPDLEVGWVSEDELRVRHYPDSEPPQRWMAGRYVDGVKDGEWNYWYPNGAARGRGSYRHGLVDGEWTLHSADGTRSVSATYRLGRLVKGEDLQPVVVGARALHDPNAHELTDAEVRNQRLRP